MKNEWIHFVLLSICIIFAKKLIMRKKHILLAAIIAATTIASSCTDKDKTEAQTIRKAAQENFEKGDYEKTLFLIDSLRNSHPKAIEERKTALKLFQDASEKLAQKQIIDTDGKLQEAQRVLDNLTRIVNAKKSRGEATAEELSSLTKAKIRRDSLQARFDGQCATVRVIREKRKR